MIVSELRSDPDNEAGTKSRCVEKGLAKVAVIAAFKLVLHGDATPIRIRAKEIELELAHRHLALDIDN
jgi:hypothetical protein